MVKERFVIKDVVILFIVSCIIFMAGNGILSLTNDNEVFYAQTAKEMIQHNSWMTPYLFNQPQFEKPILIYWLIRLGYILFGVSSFGARFFPALFAAFGVIGVYLLCLLGLKDKQKAILSSLILMSAGFYVGLAKTVFTDMVFSTLILFSFLSFYWAYTIETRKTLGLLFFALFSGLAVLTKGPLGLIIITAAVIIFLLFKKDLKFIFCKATLWSISFFLVIAAPWYILMIKLYGNSFVQEFFYNVNARRIVEAQHGEHNTWYYYPSFIISCSFPWSLFVLASLLYLPRYLRSKDKSFYFFLACWMAVIFLIFQLASSKVANYIFPIFPPLAILAGSYICDMLTSNKGSRIIFYMLLVMVCLLFIVPFGLIFATIRFSSYLTYKTPIYFLIPGFLALAITAAYFLKKKYLLKGVYCLVLVNVLLMFALPLAQNNFGQLMSSQEISEYLIKNYKVDNTIICSKYIVRGVRYYTDRDVAIVDFPGKPFFSPHPVTAFNSEGPLKEFFLKQGTTYCIIKKNGTEDIRRSLTGELQMTTLKVIGKYCILKVVRI